MRPLRGAVWGCALILLAVSAVPVQAAWCNVFQVCFFHHRATTSYYVAPAPCCQPCCPQPVCSTSYVQRCYYQPVTTYQTRSYYEPVTTYQTSYYYEPVTSYRYSCYYDPCSCSYQQVACPTTSYRLRSQCCPVQSWVQRCCSVPVTTYQQAFYYEPVTTCCTPSCAPPCTPTAMAAAPPPNCGPAVPPAPLPQQQPPAVSEQRPPQGAPGVTEYPGSNGTSTLPYNRYYPPANPQDTMPPASGSSYRQALPRSLQQSVPAPPPTVKLDRIVALPDPGSNSVRLVNR
jgi:hypothetical protein